MLHPLSSSSSPLSYFLLYYTVHAYAMPLLPPQLPFPTLSYGVVPHQLSQPWCSTKINFLKKIPEIYTKVSITSAVFSRNILSRKHFLSQWWLFEFPKMAENKMRKKIAENRSMCLSFPNMHFCVFRAFKVFHIFMFLTTEDRGENDKITAFWWIFFWKMVLQGDLQIFLCNIHKRYNSKKIIFDYWLRTGSKINVSAWQKCCFIFRHPLYLKVVQGKISR